MDLRTIIIVVFFIILISIQYTLNRILFELRNIKEILYRTRKSD
ncbi:hypothetical protein [Anaerosalibacter massiliensis]|nr:hypothetical protein [Anaerosalibacter massiliensis]